MTWQENLFSNLFLVSRIPEKIYSFKIKNIQMFNYQALDSDIAYYKTNNVVYTFSDIIDEKIGNNIDKYSLETLSTIDLVKKGNINIVTTLLNKEGLIRQKDEDLLFNTADLIYAYGARKIVYVIKNNRYSSLFQRSPMYFQVAATVENATNIQEAEEILDERRPGRLLFH